VLQRDIALLKLIDDFLQALQGIFEFRHKWATPKISFYSNSIQQSAFQPLFCNPKSPALSWRFQISESCLQITESFEPGKKLLQLLVCPDC
jgi:hypothetical protein